MIWFLWFKVVMLLLFVLIFVVVMFVISVVNFWCQENSWLCVGVFWPSLARVLCG